MVAYKKRIFLIIASFTCFFVGHIERLEAAESGLGSPVQEEAAYWERVGAWKDLRIAADSIEEDRVDRELKWYLKQLELAGITQEAVAVRAAALRAVEAAKKGAFPRAELWLDITKAIDTLGHVHNGARLSVEVEEGVQGWLSGPMYLFKMALSMVKDPSLRLGLFAFLGLVASLVLCFAACSFLFIDVFRKIWFLHHRLGHWALFPLPLIILKLWILAFVLIGLSLGVGLLPSLVLLTALLASFHVQKQRYVLIVLLLMLCTLPIMNHAFWAQQAYRSSEMVKVERCEEGDCTFFEEGVLGWPLEAEFHYAKGLMHARKANLVGAEIELKKAVERGLLDPGLHEALGNVQLLRLVPRCPVANLTPDLARWVKDAQDQYKVALSYDEQRSSAHYGLALSSKLLGENSAANEHYQLFQSLHVGRGKRENASGFSICPEPRESMLGRVRWTGLSHKHHQVVADKILEARGFENIVVYQELFLGAVNPSEFAVFCLLVALYLLLLAPTAARVLGSNSCSRCSDLFCPKCASIELKTDLCQKCLMDHLQIAIADPQDVWRRQVRHDRKALNLGRWALVLGLILPGLGSVLRERSVRGLILLLYAWTGFVVFLGALGFVPGWPPYLGIQSAEFVSTCCWILVPSYILGFWEAVLAGRVELK